MNASALSTFFRPQAAGEPFPILNRDGPNQWLDDVIAFGIRDFTYPLITDPRWITYGYVTKATRESMFERHSLQRWPSGYTTPRPINLFTYRQIELLHVNGIDTTERRDWNQHRLSFLYGNVENMSVEDPATHPLHGHVDILPPRAMQSQSDTFIDRYHYAIMASQA